MVGAAQVETIADASGDDVVHVTRQLGFGGRIRSRRESALRGDVPSLQRLGWQVTFRTGRCQHCLELIGADSFIPLQRGVLATPLWNG